MEENKEHRFRDTDKETMKEAMKEALREWLDEKYLQFGKWSMHSLLAAALVGLVWFIGWTQWHK